MGSGQDRFTLSLSLFLLATFFDLPLRLGFGPFAIPVGAFFLGQFCRIFGAPGLGNPALPAAEDASSDFISVQDIPGVRTPVTVGFDAMQCPVRNDVAGIIQAGSVDRLVKLKNDLRFSSIHHKITVISGKARFMSNAQVVVFAEARFVAGNNAAGRNGLLGLIQRLLFRFATVITGSGSLPPSLIRLWVGC
ncbi:hypothetical protein BN874_230019 [Candidatus Contendobacter odensis Run_B_J11]|uniref:Uncharacterized protein n=1 Tax=Candidatus Contendobacter odensis Run_B_J11 TaxID=1400861 RepID=A0A7U7GC09_9GAMM|nr:hypothetical protein BN874_230019 [Candidatus Contendobacter odensis Run_B_J11]